VEEGRVHDINFVIIDGDDAVFLVWPRKKFLSMEVWENKECLFVHLR